MKASQVRQAVRGLVKSADKIVSTWEYQMDMWSQEQAGVSEMPKFPENLWDILHSLRGLDPEAAEQFDYLIGLGY